MQGTTSEVPAAVRGARHAAEAAGFAQSCSDATGRLLQVLAARCAGGTLLEVGTGCGVGAAWIASGMGPDCRLVTFEHDGVRASVARDVLRPFGDGVDVRTSDWRTVDLGAPVQLGFVDARSGKWEDQQAVVDRLAPGGVVVLDDFTPFDQLDWDEDPVRDWWTDHPDLVATEVLVSPAEAVLLATRRHGSSGPAAVR